MTAHNSMGMILEGLYTNRVNEAKNYTFLTNKSKEGVEMNYSKFKAEVEKFAKNMLPRMDTHMKMVFELDDKSADLTIYGWKDMYKDEEEFSRVNDKKSMEKHISSLLKACGILGKFQSVFVSTYWDAKQTLGYKKRTTYDLGPYVQVHYSTDDIYDRG